MIIKKIKLALIAEMRFGQAMKSMRPIMRAVYRKYYPTLILCLKLQIVFFL